MKFALPWVTLVVCVTAPAYALDVRTDVAARAEVRPRTTGPGDKSTAGVTGDLELDPSAQITFGTQTSFLLQYAPTLIWREPQLAVNQLLPLHRARIAFQHRWSKATVSLSQEGSIGKADISALRPPDASSFPQAGTVPGAEVQTLGAVSYVRSASLLSLDGQPTDRLSLAGSAGYTVSGSTDGSQLPLQYGPVANARMRYAVTRNDALTTGAQFSNAQFLTGQEQMVAQLTETWDRILTRSLFMSLSGGAAFTRDVITEEQIRILNQGPTPVNILPGTYIDILPVASASLTAQMTQPFQLSFLLRLAPFSDRFTGLVYERVEARGQGDYRINREWAAMMAAGGALAVSLGTAPQAGDNLIFGEGSVAWTPKTWLVFQAAFRVLRAEQPRTNLVAPGQAVGSVSVTVRDQSAFSF